MNVQLLLFSSNKVAHYIKEWTTPSGVLEQTNGLLDV